jgi:uncharacterized protein
MLTEVIPKYSTDANGSVFQTTNVFDFDSDHVLINGKLGTLLVCNNTILNEIKSKQLSDDLKFKLIQRGFITHNNSNHFSTHPQILPKFFIIDVTQACNLRCSYCFRNLENEVHTISEERMEAITNYLISYAKENDISEIHIQPWGGEPLIAFNRIKQMYRLLNESGINFQISIETNGCLVTPQIAEELHSMNIGVGISLDGTPEIHNAQRPTVNDGFSFDSVLNGIKNLNEAGYDDKLGIVTVLTQNNRKYLDKVLEFYTKELNIKKFKLNVVKDSANNTNKDICINPTEYAELELSLLNKLIELNKNGFSITEFNIRDKFLNLLTRGKNNICISQGCMGGIKMIGFDQKGNIYPCDLTDFPEFRIGSIDNGDLIEQIKSKKDCNEFFNKKDSELCNDCPWWFYCKGGCTSSLKYRNNKIDGVDEFECEANRSLYPQLLKLIVEEPEIVEKLIDTKLE